VRTELLCLFIRTRLLVSRTMTPHVPYGLHCFVILPLPKYYFFNGGVQLLGQGTSKGYLLLEIEVPLILYGLRVGAHQTSISCTNMSSKCIK
jgi:hypothetical protein